MSECPSEKMTRHFQDIVDLKLGSSFLTLESACVTKQSQLNVHAHISQSFQLHLRDVISERNRLRCHCVPPEVTLWISKLCVNDHSHKFMQTARKL